MESGLVKLKNVLSGQIYDFRQNMMGKILTIIDASISDREQRKAIKDLISTRIYEDDTLSWLNYRIGNILLEYDEKFGGCQSKMTPEDLLYLRDNECPGKIPSSGGRIEYLKD